MAVGKIKEQMSSKVQKYPTFYKIYELMYDYDVTDKGSGGRCRFAPT